MQMRAKFLTSFFVVGLAIGSVFAQQAAPPPNSSPDAHIVRVRTGESAGWCVGYCDHQTTIHPGSIVTVSRSFSEKRKYPEMKMKSAITKQDWEDLQHFIDAKVLAAFTGPIGCPGCVDQPVEWAEVQFSDGTKKSVSYNVGNAPPAIAALLQKIRTIGAKPEPRPPL